MKKEATRIQPNEFKFRPAQLKDISFLTKTIFEAEKSGTKTLSYAKIFGMHENEIATYIEQCFEEEIDGCELSISSYLIAEYQDKPVAAVCAWIEGIEGIPSTQIKANVLNFILPAESIKCAMAASPIIQDVQIDIIPNSLYLSGGYVLPDFRGYNLLGILMDKKTKSLLSENPEVKYSCAHVFKSNKASLRTCEKLGYIISITKTSSSKNILDYLPCETKHLLVKNI